MFTSAVRPRLLGGGSGLGDRALLTPLLLPRDASPKPITAAGLAAFCVAPDAPAWIIVPLDGRRALPNDIFHPEWIAPIVDMQQFPGGAAGRPLLNFKILPCAAAPLAKM